jgi:hypothetical protein
MKDRKVDRGAKGKPCFGTFFVPKKSRTDSLTLCSTLTLSDRDAGGVLKVGDRIRIVERQEDPSELVYRGLYNSLNS